MSDMDVRIPPGREQFHRNCGRWLSILDLTSRSNESNTEQKSTVSVSQLAFRSGPGL